MEDALLLELLRCDRERGMAALMEQYAPLVRAVVRGKLAPFCPEEVEPCTADTFADFYLDLEKYDPARGSLRAWLCVMARHNALDCLRRRRREADHLSLDGADAPQIPGDFDLEGDLTDRALRTALLEAVTALGQPDREIMVRKYYLGQSSREIAAALGLTVSGVDTRAHRSIRKLRKRFGGVWE